MKPNLSDLTRYLEKNLTDTIHTSENSLSRTLGATTKAVSYSEEDAQNLEELMQGIGETFHEMLFRKIQENDKPETEVYKKAGIDRKLFSKIRSNPAYHPRKGTVLALAVALELNINETIDFLAKAGYALSPASKGDLIVKYFIERHVYDICAINYALYKFNEPLLGG